MFDRFEKNIQNVVINGVPSHMVSQEDVSEKFGVCISSYTLIFNLKVTPRI